MVVALDPTVDMDVYRQEISIGVLGEADFDPIRIVLMIQDLHPLAD